MMYLLGNFQHNFVHFVEDVVISAAQELSDELLAAISHLLLLLQPVVERLQT